MKPFNLEEAPKGAPVVTRDGRKVLRVAHFPDAKEGYRIVAHYEGSMTPICFHDTARMYEGSRDSCFDLFMATTEKTKWVNLFPGEGYTHAWHVYGTQEEADAGAVRISRSRVGNKAHPIEIEE